MYFTDRGIEELVDRRGEETVTFEWLGEQLRTFVDLNPEFETPIERFATWLARDDEDPGEYGRSRPRIGTGPKVGTITAMTRAPDLGSRPIRRVELDPAAEIDRGAWWARIPAIRAVLEHGLNIPAGVTFLVGENGSGKSTLVEALAAVHGLNPEGGSRSAMHSTRVTESPLGGALRVIRTPGGRPNAYFLRAETTHGLYTYLEQLPGPNPDQDLHDRSHGEGFLELLERKFRGYGFYLMDEPEAPLSFTSTLGLLARLDDLRTEGAQVVVATHSPLLTALPDATILELGPHGIRRATWEDLEIVTNWRRFLGQPDAYLRALLS